MIIIENCQNKTTCVRIIISSTISAILIIVGILNMIHIYKFRNQFGYEHLPLLTATVQAIIHLNDYLIYSSNHMAEIANYLQVVTFAFIAQSFSQLYYRVKIQEAEKKNNQVKISYNEKQLYYSQVFQGVFYSMMFLIFLVLGIRTESQTCNWEFYGAFIIISVQIFVSCLYANLYGYKLVNAIELVGSVKDLDQQKSKVQPNDKKNQSGDLQYQLVEDPQIILDYKYKTNEQSELIEERMKQIKSVSFGMAFTTISYIIIMSVSGIFLSKFECDYNVKNLNWREQIVLFLLSLVQLTPCVYLSVAFYYIPKVERLEKVKPITKSDEFDLKFDQSLQKRDSMLMSSRDDLFISQLKKSDRPSSISKDQSQSQDS